MKLVPFSFRRGKVVTHYYEKFERASIDAVDLIEYVEIRMSSCTVSRTIAHGSNYLDWPFYYNSGSTVFQW